MGDIARQDGGESLFLTADPASHRALADQAAAVAEAIAQGRAADRPFSGIDPATLKARIDALDPCPPQGVPFAEALADLQRLVLVNAVHVSDPRCVAHLHCPTLLPAAVAELAIGATNQSLDSFDQAPAATFTEDALVRWLAGLLGLNEGSGVFTSGGTASNLLGLFLAREKMAAATGRTQTGGLTPEAERWRIVTSAAAHHSVARSAALLGLGAGAVVSVPTAADFTIDVAVLRDTLDGLRTQGLKVIAVVATAGTTDHGAIDDLAAVAQLARAHDAWMHVDAAVGSALALSPRLAPLLEGIELADSVTADLHKLWFQPIGASVLLVRDPALLDAANHHSDYLHRPEDEEAGVLNLSSRSLDTSRRFDALKVLLSLRTVGRERMAAMVEHIVDLATQAGTQIEQRDDLELLAAPSTVTVLLRFRPVDGALSDDRLDAVNVAIQRELFADGEAIIGRTRIDGRPALKLTFVNPVAGPQDVAGLLDLIVACGRRQLP